jgi:hypothetical protein
MAAAAGAVAAVTNMMYRHISSNFMEGVHFELHSLSLKVKSQ